MFLNVREQVVGHIGFEPMTSALSRRHSEPTELMTRECKSNQIQCIA
jgi:hypothetical protein